MKGKIFSHALWISRLILITFGSVLMLYIIGFYIIFTIDNFPSKTTKAANENLEYLDKGNYNFFLSGRDYYMDYTEDIDTGSIYFRIVFTPKHQGSINVTKLEYTYNGKTLLIESKGDIGYQTIENLSLEDFKKNYLNVDYISIHDIKADSSTWDYFPNPFIFPYDFDMTINYKSTKDTFSVSIPLINESYSYEVEQITNSANMSSYGKIDTKFHISFKPTNEYAGAMIY